MPDGIQTEMRMEKPVEARKIPAVDIDLPDKFLAIIEYLDAYCRGPANAATALTIGQYLGFPGRNPDRQVRHLISLHMHQFPFVVCGNSRVRSSFQSTVSPKRSSRYRLMRENVVAP